MSYFKKTIKFWSHITFLKLASFEQINLFCVNFLDFLFLWTFLKRTRNLLTIIVTSKLLCNFPFVEASNCFKMGRFYCDYCDVYLTHDSPSVRKVHNKGRKHREMVYTYYKTWMEQQAQKLIDATTRAFMQRRWTMLGRKVPL